MDDNWEAVADAINIRLHELGMTQYELATKSGVSVATIRELQRKTATRQRHPRTLSTLSTALGWPADHLDRLRRGEAPPDSSVTPVPARSPYDEISERVDVLQAEFREVSRHLDERLARLEDAVRRGEPPVPGR